MRKFLLLLMTFSILFSFAACNNSDTTNDTTDNIVTDEIISNDTTEGATEDVGNNTEDDNVTNPTDGESNTDTSNDNVNDVVPPVSTEDNEGNVTQPTPTQPEDDKPVPTEPAKPTPTEPIKPTPTEPTPTEPTKPTPTEPAPTEPEETKPVTVGTTGITLSVSQYELNVSEKLTISATVLPNNATNKTVTWTSNNASVATVSNGIVTAHKAGTAKITAKTSGGQTATCTITVKQVVTETEPATPSNATFTGLEVVSSTRPNAYYLANGQDLLTRLYGKNKAFQTGDTITVKVKMSEGIATNFKITDVENCTYTVKDDCIILTVGETNSVNGECWIEVDVTNNGVKTSKSISFKVINCNTDISTKYGVLVQEFRSYWRRKGLTYVTNGTDMTGYTDGTDDSGSYTGYINPGADDYIAVANNSRYIDKIIELLDWYARQGYTRLHFELNYYYFTSTAE